MKEGWRRKIAERKQQRGEVKKKRRVERMAKRGICNVSVAQKSKRSALLLLPVCRYEWSVWGQMSANSGGPYTERRWVEPQLLPLTSQRTRMPLSLTHSDGSHTLFLTGEEGEIVTEGFGWSLPPHSVRAMTFLLSFLLLSLLCPSLSPPASHSSPYLSVSLSSPSPRSSSLIW